jgi:hypothetical protein
MGFVPQGEDRAPASGSFRTIGGTGTNPNSPTKRSAPPEPGMYNLILRIANAGVIARQAIKVVARPMGFQAIGSVEPGMQANIGDDGLLSVDLALGDPVPERFCLSVRPFGIGFAGSLSKRLSFGVPGVNKRGKVSNGNYIWMPVFHSHLFETGRSGARFDH